ncbi:MAG: hypothetical protein QOF77_1618 [Solirubrobacteraceae bacterium]|nr:hypothetical protein [Solirubrobacteraceae bacterium]
MRRNDVAILNRTTVMTDPEAEAIVAALQIQIDRDFAPAWGITARLVFVPTTELTGWEEKWNIVLLDHSDQPGPLGYHQLTPDGLPQGKVFVADDLKYHVCPSVTLSHELLETLGDPHSNLLVRDSTKDGSPFFAYENCDPVESDELAYEIDGVRVSNFVLPRYFDLGATDGPFDFLGHLSRPLSTAPDGYLNMLDTETGQVIPVKLSAAGRVEPAFHQPRRPGNGSRRQRRNTPRPAWKPSKA